MRKQEIIDMILENSSPTQKYIVNRDILGVDIHNPDMLALQ